jgi:hypothetical protein
MNFEQSTLSLWGYNNVSNDKGHLRRTFKLSLKRAPYGILFCGPFKRSRLSKSFMVDNRGSQQNPIIDNG